MSTSKAASTLAGIVALQGIITVVGIVISGPLSDKFGRKPFIIISGLGIAVSLVVTAFVPNTLVFQIVYGGVFGLALGILNGVVSPITADELPNQEEVGKDMGLINLSQLIPQAVGAPLGSLILLIPAGNYTVMLLLGAVLALVGGFLILAAKKIR
jgi:MFS family permease